MSSTISIDFTLPWTQLIATNAQTVFDTSWTADDSDDIHVYARATGTDPDDETDIVDPDDYTITFEGGNQHVRVTFDSGRTTGDIITITRFTPADRLNVYTNTNFTPSMLNGDFGRVVMMIQERVLENLI